MIENGPTAFSTHPHASLPHQTLYNQKILFNNFCKGFDKLTQDRL